MLTQDLGIATAYGYAKSKGYTGTEEEFAELMASYADVAESAEASAESASSSASDSEAYAVGKRGGTDVGSEDVAYHNNAKYYADQAGSSASSASSDASSASSSKSDAEAYAVGKRNGTDVESSDVAYHNNAKYYSEQASDSASTATSAKDTAVSSKDTAVSKAGEASTSAGTATTKAGEASASATSANAAKLVSEGYAVGKQNGTDVESGSPYYENNAKYYAEQAEETLHEYARIDGYYEDLTAGNAEQLVTGIRANDQTPYLFRTSGGSVDIGDREYINGIVGGTVAFNQLVKNGNFADGTTSWLLQNCTASVSGNKLTMTATTEQPYIQQIASFTANHKYAATLKMRADANNGEDESPVIVMNWQSGGYSGHSAIRRGTTEEISCILAPSTNAGNINIYGSTNATVGDKFTIENVQAFDLTLMFGSTIADYIYSLEQATAGAGVAFFKSLFPKPYYAYNSGELMSVSGLVSHDMVGFNACPASPTYATSLDNVQFDIEKAIRIIKDVPYCLSFKGIGSATNWRLLLKAWTLDGEVIALPRENFFTDSLNTFYPNLSGYYLWGNNEDDTLEVLTFNQDCYIQIYFGYGNTSSSMSIDEFNVNISWDGSEDGNYEPYQKWSYPLDSDLELRGIPKIENGNLYYDGDVYEPSGEVQRLYAEYTFTGNENWYWDSDWSAFAIRSITDAESIPSDVYPSARMAEYTPAKNYASSVFRTNMSFILNSKAHAPNTFAIINNAYNATTIAEFKQYIAGKKIVYKLATPTTETADPYTNPQIVNDFGTEEFVISNTVDVPIPVGHNTDYPINLKAQVEMMPHSPSGDGDYIVRQTNGTNEYVSIANNATIQNILSRLEALEGGN